MSSIFGDKPVVGIIMGSESDMPTMEACMKQLEELDVPYEVKVASAHRKPASWLFRCSALATMKRVPRSKSSKPIWPRRKRI